MALQYDSLLCFCYNAARAIAKTKPSVLSVTKFLHIVNKFQIILSNRLSELHKCIFSRLYILNKSGKREGSNFFFFETISLFSPGWLT